MVGPRMRPRFEAVVAGSPEDLLCRLDTALRTAGCPFEGAIVGKHAQIKVPAEARHFWSPQLDVEFNAHEGGVWLHGLFSPRPDIWTMFMAFYAILGFGALVGLFFGFSQWWLGQTPTALWGIPAAALLIGAVYGIALMGQGLAQTQMQALRDFIEDVLAVSVHEV